MTITVDKVAEAARPCTDGRQFDNGHTLPRKPFNTAASGHQGDISAVSNQRPCNKACARQMTNAEKMLNIE